MARLKGGGQELVEDPGTDRVEPARVQAFIDDGVRPLMQVAISDSSALSVTTNHLFFVDGDPDIATSQPTAPPT